MSAKTFVPVPTPDKAASPNNHGKRIGVLIVAYNALTTLSSKVLKRIPPEVWANIEEVAVFDDASKDETYELALGYKALFGEAPSETLRRPAQADESHGDMSWMRYVARMFVEHHPAELAEHSTYPGPAVGRAELLK